MDQLADWQYFWCLILLVGFLTGVVDGIGGSGGLIITPFLMASGLPPQLAIGTSKLGSLSSWVLAAKKFHENKQIKTSLLPVLIALSVLGAFLGAITAVEMDPQSLFLSIGFLLIVISPLSLVIRAFGLIQRQYGRTRRWSGYGLYGLAMIYAAFFGGGSGVFLILSLVSFLGLTTLQAHATNMIPIIVMTIIAVIVFGWNNYIDYKIAALLFLATGAGALVGSHLAIKGGSAFVRHIVGVFAFIMGVKFIWDYWPV